MSETEMHWIFGPHGCGKTLYVMQKYGENGVHLLNSPLSGCHLSAEEKVILLEDVNSNVWKMSPRVLLNGLRSKASHFIVTSNVEPQKVFRRRWVEAGPLLRQMVFWRARRGEAHELLLQRVEWDDGGCKWVPRGEELKRRVEYGDSAAERVYSI